VRPCSSDSHFKLETIDVTVPGSLSWTLFNANHAALSCIESSWDIWFVLYGSQAIINFQFSKPSEHNLSHINIFRPKATCLGNC
jgi:hypothetical protein